MLPGDLVTPREAARILRVHISTVYRWVLHGQLRGWKRAGWRYLVSRKDVEGMVAEVVVGPAAPPGVDVDRAEAAEKRLRERLGMK